MSRKASFILVIVGYLLAIIIGGIGYLLLGTAIETENKLLEIIIKCAFMDVIATIIVYIFALFLKNTSYYDPYWSVWPPIIILFPMIMESNLWNLTSILILIVVLIYAFRLTFNWAIRFKGFKPEEEDYRYRKYRNTLHPALFELVNFFGLIMMPTVLVFFGSIPLLYGVYYGNTFNPLYIIGLVIAFSGVIIEIFSDLALIKWKKDPSNKGKLLKIGLWKYSRHPNYLGEVTVWVGFGVLGLTVCLINNIPNGIWINVLGAVLIFLLFNTISVKLMDDRMKARYIEYQDYMKQTSRFFILPRRNINEK